MLEIDIAQGITVTPEAKEILEIMFATHQRLFVDTEFGGGFEESRVYRVHHDNSLLPIVVKIAPRHLILQEQEAFTTCIRSQFANVVAIKGDPVWSSTGLWGGLHYDQAGHNIFSTQSFYDYYRDSSTVDAARPLNRLFQVMVPIAQNATSKRFFNIQGSYDRLLPVNLLIAADDSLPDEDLHLIEQQTFLTMSLKPGSLVSLQSDFLVSEVDIHKSELTFNWHPSLADNWKSYRVRVQSVDNIEQYQIGETVSIKGIVLETRQTLLQALAEQALGQEMGGVETTVTLPDGTELPNPLQKWSKILAEKPSVKVACIHGDLNPENILIDTDSGDYSLIDFTQARQDHLLHDLLRIETGIVTRLLPEALAKANLPAETIFRLYEQLHCTAVSTTQLPLPALHPALKKPFALLTAVRNMARTSLYNAAHWADPASWAEYYNGLTLYLLGALKFKNLDGLPKLIAFWGAATAQKLVTNPPPCSKSFCRVRVIVSVLFAVVLIVGGYFGWQYFRAPQPQGEPLAVLLNFNPEVAVQRRDSSDLEEASFPQELFREDVVLTYENASALIYCQENGLFFQLPAESTMAITCEETDDPRLIARLESTPLTISKPISITLAPDNTRSPREERISIPILLSPRNTFIADNRPTFTWQPVEGAKGYRVSVSVGEGRSWSRETTDSSLPYPADEPPLEPGSVNIVTLVTLDNTFTADTSLLNVLDEEAMATLTEKETAVRSLGLDSASQAYLLAQLYQEENLLVAAINQLNGLAQGETRLTASIWQQLGDLYFASELYVLSEENYQMALDTAIAADDLNAQAAAYIGLSQTAYAFKETEQAVNYLETAEFLYRQAGQEALAELVAAEKDRLGQ